MTQRNEEYRRRFNAICSERSIVRAGEILQLPYTTIGKWYHDNRDGFPPDVQEEIRSNGGRKVTQSAPLEMREVESPKDVEDMRAASRLVDALFERFNSLRQDNERLTLENERLRREVERDGHSTDEKVQRLLADVLS